MSREALRRRYDDWIDAAVRRGALWALVGADDFTAVIPDPHDRRDLHMLFLDEDAAARHAVDGAEPRELDLGTLTDVLRRAEIRGDGVALWGGSSWLRADAGPMADDLRPEPQVR